ncbi:MAG: polyamine aminopropyltransferase [Pseudomonadota bacterium]
MSSDQNAPKASEGDWIEEAHSDVTLRYRVKRRLFNGESAFQKVEVVDSEKFGRMLFIDGYVMVTERDEFIYHDMIAHPALFTHPDPKRVLIIGGGDGGTAREVLRHQGLERIVMVEIDAMVVDACKEFIPQTAAALDDPRLDLIIGDGVGFMAESDETFDVIIVDSTEPIGPATPLFGDAFYRDVDARLSEKGVVVAQGESPNVGAEGQAALFQIVSNAFPIACAYNYANMTYPCGFWSFVYGSKGVDPLSDFDPVRVANSDLEFQYYNADIHRAAFALPSFQQHLFTSTKR